MNGQEGEGESGKNVLQNEVKQEAMDDMRKGVPVRNVLRVPGPCNFPVENFHRVILGNARLAHAKEDDCLQYKKSHNECDVDVKVGGEEVLVGRIFGKIFLK